MDVTLHAVWYGDAPAVVCRRFITVPDIRYVEQATATAAAALFAHAESEGFDRIGQLTPYTFAIPGIFFYA
jgi:hypothetical protein